MGGVEFSHSDFAAAGEQLRLASELSDDDARPDFSSIGSALVESTLLRVHDIVRGAETSLSDQGGELVARTTTVHSELQHTDAELAGGP